MWLGQGYQVDVGVLGFAGSFRRVSQTGLSGGWDTEVSGALHSAGWRTSWVVSRRVVVGGEAAGPVEVASGVPRGTVLGPMVLMIYVDYIAENMGSGVRLFTDDCVVYRQIVCKL